MPTYVTLVKYTADGIQHMNESPARLDKAREVAAELGGELTEFYLTMGEYDAIVFFEHESDTAAAQALLTIAQSGAVRTETMRAFTEDEYRDLVAEL